ncbi:MAG: hypothetical protein AB7G93_21400 [Bdellovibrionales bacterium]
MIRSTLLRKTVVGAFALTGNIASAVSPVVGDGCFQLYTEESLHPVICILASTEESLSGEGVEVAQIGPNGGPVLSCQETSGMQVTSSSTIFYIGNEELVMTPKTEKGGTVKDGTTEYLYSRTDEKFTANLLQKVEQSGLCKRR